MVKKKFTINMKKNEKKMKTTSQRAENLVHVQQHMVNIFLKDVFLILLYIADMTV